ncbi:MAG TPA: biopolymer transporter ExbD [Myxococcales bacterium]|nr:biopolymer transporter ExbD [Myxococcales bacterium]
MAIRKFRKPEGKPPASDINVTPLVDIVLVLLIIFMVVTPLIEKDIEIRLPDEKQDETMELPPDQQSQIMVQISAAGELALNTEHIASMEELGERLKRALKNKSKGDRLVFFLPEDKANYGIVVQALDIAKVSGADILGMVTMDMSAPPAGGGAPTPEAATAPTTPP